MKNQNSEINSFALDSKRASLKYSMSRSLLYKLADEKKINSFSLREAGKIKGKRLFEGASIEAYLRSCSTMGGAQ